MASLPDTWRVPVIRTDFTDDALWARLTEEIASPTEEGFEAGVDFVEDRTLEGLDEPALVRCFPRTYPSSFRHPVIFVVDSRTVASSDHPILVIDLQEDGTDQPFRATPRQIQAIENNLSIANMDFFEFAQSIDNDGVFRGFE
jgi:uncharacterized protein DUF6924